jgi:hypothetical protein
VISNRAIKKQHADAVTKGGHPAFGFNVDLDFGMRIEFLQRFQRTFERRERVFASGFESMRRILA